MPLKHVFGMLLMQAGVCKESKISHFLYKKYIHEKQKLPKCLKSAQGLIGVRCHKLNLRHMASFGSCQGLQNIPGDIKTTKRDASAMKMLKCV